MYQHLQETDKIKKQIDTSHTATRMTLAGLWRVQMLVSSLAFFESACTLILSYIGTIQ